MNWGELATGVASGLSVPILVYIARKLKRVVDMLGKLGELETRINDIDSENKKAHGDLWTELRRLAGLVEQR